MSNISITASNVIPFSFGKQRVRTLLVDGDPWFSVQDILRSLDYTDSYKPARAAAHVPDQWKGVHRLHTPGGTQQMLMLSEQGLYFFLGRSDKPKALPFQMWIAGEVLPDIRRTGRYEDHGKMATLMDELIGMSELNVIKGLIRDKSKAVPADQRQGFQLVMHNRLHTRFNVPRTELIPAAQFEQACNFIGAYALEGEYIPADKPGDLGMSTQEWVERCHVIRAEQAYQPRGRMILTGSMIASSDSVKPLHILLNKLEKLGVDVSAYDAHYHFLLEYLRENRRFLADAAKLMDRASENQFAFRVGSAA